MMSPPRRIRPLDPLLANQIAAGEVVERPASVLKELLENSLDAGARQIRIDVEEGGVALIRVQDDGHGICRDDLELALAPHATSKIYTQAELGRLGSLGFRGEALASIASVTRLQICSRSHDAEQAWSISNQFQGLQPCAHPRGSTVEVRDLFYNLPARRKFLRSTRTESEHLHELVRSIVLSHPHVGLAFYQQGRQVLAVRPANDATGHLARLRTICGKAFVQVARRVDFSLPGLALQGWLLPAAHARPLADTQYFFINRRMIRDRVVMHALRQAFADSLPPGRHPAYVLYLQMEPAQVDVNVHPAKHEVRFREMRQVHDFLQHAVRSTLIEGSGEDTGFLPGRIADQAPGHSPPYTGVQRTSVPVDRHLGVVGGRFLLLDAGADGLRIIDLPAVRAEQAARLMRDALAGGGTLKSQPLLLPVSLQLDGQQQEVLLEYGRRVAALGFVVDELGPQQWVLRGLPGVLRQAGPERLLQQVLQALAAGQENGQICDRLAACLQSLPERSEWEGLVAASAGNPKLSRTLSIAELEKLLV